MAWVLFEVLLAFGIAVFIVWWTFPKDKKRKARDTSSGVDKGQSDAAGSRPRKE